MIGTFGVFDTAQNEEIPIILNIQGVDSEVEVDWLASTLRSQDETVVLQRDLTTFLIDAEKRWDLSWVEPLGLGSVGLDSVDFLLEGFESFVPVACSLQAAHFFSSHCNMSVPPTQDSWADLVPC